MFLVSAIVFAAIEACFTHWKIRAGEFVAKPMVMLILLTWAWLELPAGVSLHVAIIFSLIGDVLLIFPQEGMFLPGLVSFLGAHLAYICYFSPLLTHAQLGQILIYVLGFGITSLMIVRPVLEVLSRGPKRSQDLIVPVFGYSVAIFIMAFFASLTLVDPSWSVGNAALVSAGSLLVLISDCILAWCKFVRPFPTGYTANIITYFAGQIGIVWGCILQHGS